MRISCSQQTFLTAAYTHKKEFTQVYYCFVNDKSQLMNKAVI